MHVQVYQRGGIKHHLMLKWAACFYANRLMGKETADTLSVNIKMCVCGLEPDDMGDCTPSNIFEVDKRTFTIRIRKTMSFATQLRTLAHEFVHVRQYATGQLAGFPILKWNNKIYDVPYDQKPWEKEAFKLEKKLSKALSRRLYTDTYYQCSKCHEYGHNARTCLVFRAQQPFMAKEFAT